MISRRHNCVCIILNCHAINVTVNVHRFLLYMCPWKTILTFSVVWFGSSNVNTSAKPP